MLHVTAGSQERDCSGMSRRDALRVGVLGLGGLTLPGLLAVMGEMGRTPKINANAGRDHWPQVMFALFAGGSLKMGQVIGQSSANVESALTAPYGAQNLLATIYHVLGIDRSLEFTNASGRPMPIITHGRPIAGLV